MSMVDTNKKLLKVLGIDLDNPENKWVSSVIVKISGNDFPIVVVEKNIIYEDEINYESEQFYLIAKDD